MNFKVVSKNNMGVVMTLILVVLLSQSQFFDFLIDAYLGRTILLAFIILIAYTNKILGLVAVLFIIIAFNQHNTNMVYSYNYYEGFDVSGNNVSLADASGNIQKDTKNEIKSQMKEIKPKNLTTNASQSTSSSETFKGREGFCMTDRETNMLRGKQSNAVPVSNNLRDQSDDISPSDKSVFSSEYASF